MTNTDLIIKSMECWLLDITKQDATPQDFTPLQIGFVKRLLERYYSPQISVEAVKELREKRKKAEWIVAKSWYMLQEEFIKDLDILLSKQQQDDTN